MSHFVSPYRKLDIRFCDGLEDGCSWRMIVHGLGSSGRFIHLFVSRFLDIDRDAMNFLRTRSIDGLVLSSFPALKLPFYPEVWTAGCFEGPFRVGQKRMNWGKMRGNSCCSFGILGDVWKFLLCIKRSFPESSFGKFFDVQFMSSSFAQIPRIFLLWRWHYPCVCVASLWGTIWSISHVAPVHSPDGPACLGKACWWLGLP